MLVSVLKWCGSGFRFVRIHRWCIEFSRLFGKFKSAEFTNSQLSVNVFIRFSPITKQFQMPFRFGDTDNTVFAGIPDQAPPAPIVKAAFESQDDFPNQVVESMQAADGTTLTLSLRDIGPPKTYVRTVNERLIEVGAFGVPSAFSLEINGVAPVGKLEAGPLAEAPPMGVDVQNLWYESG